jgi:hypothetical protein
MAFNAILPTIIVEAALSPGNPVSGSGTITLDSAGFGLLDTDWLAGADSWVDISQWVLSFTISRDLTRVQGPLYQAQAGTASIVLNNSDGRFDPDNLSGPYVSSGVSQVHAMVPVRIRAVYNGISYSLFRGFADGWQEPVITFAGGVTNWTLNATDGFKALSNITLAPLGSPVGANEDAGARVNRILNSAGWYTGQGAGARLTDTGNSTLQATSYGDTALNLLQLATDCEIGRLYIDGSGAVVFRNRHELLTNPLSVTSQATFSDSPASIAQNLLSTPNSDFEGSYSNWFVDANCSLAITSAQSHGGSQSLQLTSTAAGNMSTGVNNVDDGTFSGVFAVTPGNSYTVSSWFLAAASPRTCQVLINWYDVNNAYLSTSAGAVGPDTTGTWTQLSGNYQAPANAARGEPVLQVLSTAAGAEVHCVDDVFFGLATGGLPCAAIGRVDDDTTIANDIQAQIVGSSNLQEATSAASIATYLFPRTYNRTDLILPADADALNWANWVLYISSTGEDRFETIQIDPQYQPDSLWPLVLGLDIGNRVTGVRNPPNVSTITKDGFIAGIDHTWDTASSQWMTTFTLQDATKYASFLTLNNAVTGQLDHNALIY